MNDSTVELKIKACTKCKIEKFDNLFGKNKTSSDGLDYHCKQCRSEYYLFNKTKEYERNKKYTSDNKKKIRERSRELYLKNRKSAIEKVKAWRNNNREMTRQQSKMHKHKRRAINKTVECNFSSTDWQACKVYFENSCAYCNMKVKLEQEHFIAVKHGGDFTKNNIIPACRSCNGSKRDSDFFLWYPKHESYSKQREHKILNYLKYNENNIQH